MQIISIVGGFVLLSFLIDPAISRKTDYCYAHNDRPYVKMSTKTAYHFVHGGRTRYQEIPDCKSIQIWMFIRHGTRYPSLSTIPSLLSVPKLRDEIIYNHKVRGYGRLCDEDIKNLEDWRMDPGVNVNNADTITAQGVEDMNLLAKRIRANFPELFSPFPLSNISSHDYKFRAASKDRTLDSLAAFMSGIYGKEVSPPQQTSLDDTLFASYKRCPNWVTDVAANPKNIIEWTTFGKGPEIQNLKFQVSERIGFLYNLTDATIFAMYDMCRYDISWRPLSPSPWCAVFTEEELRILEYRDDLQDYYKRSYGHEYNTKLGCPPMKDMFDSFKRLEDAEYADEPKGIFNIGTSGSLHLFMTALGLAKDPEPPLASNYHAMGNRRWKTSEIGSFAANVAAVFYKCNDSRSPNKVMIYLSEKPVMYEGCDLGLCDWEYLKNKFEKFATHCETNFCFSNSAIPSLISPAATVLLALAMSVFSAHDHLILQSFAAVQDPKKTLENVSMPTSFRRVIPGKDPQLDICRIAETLVDQPNFFKMQIILGVLLSFLAGPVISRDTDYCYAYNDRPYLKMGGKTAYHFVHGGKTRYQDVPDCKPIQIWMLIRHGASYPSPRIIPQLIAVPKLRDQIIYNHETRGQGHLCDADLDNLKLWRLDPGLNFEKADTVTEQGMEDINLLARRIKTNFPQLFPPLISDIGSQNYKFRAAPEQRSSESLTSFVSGIFDQGETPRWHTPLNDSLFASNTNCPNWETEVANNPENMMEWTKFKAGPEFQNLISNVSRRVGFLYNLTEASISGMYDMCRYEKAWRVSSLSAWCAVFSEEELKILEYKDDLEDYYKHSYGHEYNTKLGCPLMKEMFDGFKKLENDDYSKEPKGIFSISHSGSLHFFMTAMGFAKDPNPLLASNYYSMSRRQWKTSEIGSFAANIAAVFYKCNNSRSSNKVMFYLAEKPVMYEGCNVGLCDWDYLKNRFQKITSNCDTSFCYANGAMSVLIVPTATIMPILTALTFFVH
ncbi:uncharacterized protein LOC105686456 [Athalia rosae]|uniref:uncharacterized protein LOC105686456 n=1 Tax=Athalia rosae TaxID=37344 RepID=UPI002034977D|nr:uncharacterized protein LOC105686456 [Athalia rosae]